MQDRLDLAVKDRKLRYDKGSCVRSFDIGNLVWCRVPGMDHKLAEVWSGPWEVVARLNAVNYQLIRLLVQANLEWCM